MNYIFFNNLPCWGEIPERQRGLYLLKISVKFIVVLILNSGIIHFIFFFTFQLGVKVRFILIYGETSIQSSFQASFISLFGYALTSNDLTFIESGKSGNR